MGNQSSQQKWACFRYNVVGPLLARPPRPGHLKEQLEVLSRREWLHPITGVPIYFSLSTIGRWYYRVKDEAADPISKLRRATRTDKHKHRSVGEALEKALRAQYKAYSSWTYQLHYDNIKALAEQDPCLGKVPSYHSIRRFMQAQGLTKKKRIPFWRQTQGTQKAQEHYEQYQSRSFESEYPNELWHLDFHTCSLPIASATGTWLKVLILCVICDASRLICHIQCYLSESADDLIHGLCQALAKRGLPRRLMTDNGAAMVAAETTQGLARLGILHDTTLRYCPNQNGKQEIIWGHLEGRLMAMLSEQPGLTLDDLNLATQAYAEIEYNRKVHSETKRTPVDIFGSERDVGRPCPSMEELRKAFTRFTHRTQRKTDGTVSISGIRFEIPSQYRHIKKIPLRYKKWNLNEVYIADPTTETIITKIYPLNKVANANGKRALLSPLKPIEPSILDKTTAKLPPLLTKLIDQYVSETGTPAYIKK